MKKINKLKIFRTLIQILFLIFLPELITLAFSQIKGVFIAISSGNFNSLIQNSMFLIILSILTLIIGRLFCGWMCIFGSLNDWVYTVSNKLFKIKYRINKKVDSYLKYLKYLVFGIIIIFVWNGLINLPSGSSPWDAYSQLFDIKYMLSEYLIGTIILLLIIVGAAFIERFFCRYLCPLGAFLGILSKTKVFKVNKERTKCSKCAACTAKCSMGIDLNRVDAVNSCECIQCFNCIGICPKSNAKLKIFNEEVNENKVASIFMAATLSAYLLTNNLPKNIANANNIVSNTIHNNSADIDSSDNTNQSQNNVINNNSSVTTTSDTQTSNKKYKDGTYIGTGRGYRPGLTVSVTIKNDKITSIEIVSSNETRGYYERASNIVPNEIITSQSINVDTVSGATRTSDGIIEAVKNALVEAEV